MQFSQHGKELLKDWEGCVLHIYRDIAGKPTIGIGHLLTLAEIRSGFFNQGITLERAYDLLTKDIAPCVDNINKRVKCSLTQNQFDALVIFSFNVGIGGFNTSSVLQDINTNHFDKVPDDMRKWNKITVNGKHVVDDGLVTRREKEIKLWKGEV